ncbi:MAG: class I SAM-dependent methyltransferase [Dehalococcoidia bacterium]
MAAQNPAGSVSAHYTRADLGTTILDTLRAMGKDPDALVPDDLAPIDQFHLRGKDATLELANLAGIRSGQQILDVGGGLGGPARTLASMFDCRVTVLDLTEEFCRTGEMLTERTSLQDRVTFRHGNALQMPFEDGSFDVAWTQHSTMNIPDKPRLYAEIARVLRPGGRLAMHEVMAGPVQPLVFPVPWAPDQSISFLLPPEEMRAAIEGAGLSEGAWVDVTTPALEWLRARVAAFQGGPPATPQLGLNLILGPAIGVTFQSLIRNIEERRVVVVEALFEREQTNR